MALAFGIRMPPCAPPAKVVEVVKKAEGYGFTHVWVPDAHLLAGQSHDVGVALSAVAMHS
jgi:alkanesulfonate monooxygenase SsuD/methylene tetrahydromethanopterin reductase-like flavin-dependent oxidoreductase (luciferase family)